MRINKDGTMDIFAGENLGGRREIPSEVNPDLKTNRFTKEWFDQDKQFTLLDVGCYDGYDSAEYIHDLGLDRSRIFSFEADPRVAECYREGHAKLIEQGKMNLIEGAVSNVDGESSTQIRVTAIPKSNDVVPVRNQILEIDLVNTTTGGNVDAQATTGKGYTVTSTGTTTTTTVTTPSSTPTSSAY